MKILIIILSLTSIPSWASQFLSYEKLYKALDVTEENVSVGVGAIILQKKLNAGLSCRKITIVYPGAVPRYSCTIVTDKFSSPELYLALDLREYIVVSSRHKKTTRKNLPGLECVKTEYFYKKEPSESSCTIQLKFNSNPP